MISGKDPVQPGSGEAISESQGHVHPGGDGWLEKALEEMPPKGRASMEEIIGLFAEDFKRERIFAGKKRLVVKEYPPEAAGAFERNGFIREMQDYTLYL